jgi:catalase
MSSKQNVLKKKVLSAIVIMACATSAYADSSTPSQLVDALNGVFGKHEGARAVHAKGIVLEGTFTPSPSAVNLSKAIHLQKTSVPVSVRFSNFAGIPDIPDNHGLASPHGMAIKFQLPDGTQTDIVTHSFNGFPSATTDDFRDLLVALGASGPDAKKPTQLDNYLGTHPAAKSFLTTPKPAPVSFATTSYFGINTFRFINAEGGVSFGRYQILPVSGNHSLSEDQAKKADPNYLEKEIQQRVEQGPVKFTLQVELAQNGDPIDNPSVVWSKSHTKIELGTIIISKVVSDSNAAEKALVFVPNQLPPGIQVEDPMIDSRSNAYAVSFGRRSQ